jgi:hypothetical protein
VRGRRSRGEQSVMFTLKDLVDISSVLGSLALVVSMLLLFRELRETNRLTRAANTQAMVDLSSPFYTSLFQDRQLAELFNQGARDFDSLDGVDQFRYKQMLIWWLIFHENVFYQRCQGLLDRHTFKPWARDLKLFVHRQNLERHWPELKGLLQDKFAAYVSLVLAEPDTELGSLQEGDLHREGKRPGALISPSA